MCWISDSQQSSRVLLCLRSLPGFFQVVPAQCQVFAASRVAFLHLPTLTLLMGSQPPGAAGDRSSTCRLGWGTGTGAGESGAQIKQDQLVPSRCKTFPVWCKQHKWPAQLYPSLGLQTSHLHPVSLIGWDNCRHPSRRMGDLPTSLLLPHLFWEEPGGNLPLLILTPWRPNTVRFLCGLFFLILSFRCSNSSVSVSLNTWGCIRAGTEPT